MLSNPQKAMIKRAQRQAQLDDGEYREILQTVTGANSSTDSRLGDRAFDRILAFIEAVFWQKLDSGSLQGGCKGNAIFTKRRYWQEKNTKVETSRDRWAAAQVEFRIASLEARIGEMGYNAEYLGAIKEKTGGGRNDITALHAYARALDRTLAGKRNHMEAAHARA